MTPARTRLVACAVLFLCVMGVSGDSTARCPITTYMENVQTEYYIEDDATSKGAITEYGKQCEISKQGEGYIAASWVSKTILTLTIFIAAVQRKDG